jgi:hypothetical protein
MIHNINFYSWYSGMLWKQKIMSTIIFTILCIIFFGVFPLVTQAACDEISWQLPENSVLQSKAQECINARAQWRANGITEYVCPQGEFFYANGQRITNETLSYLVAVSVSLGQIDTDILKYMKKLQDTRNSDPVTWQSQISSCTEKIRDIYTNICDFGVIEGKLNAWKEKPDTTSIISTNVYPQQLCRELTTKKVEWWFFMQSMIASTNVTKTQKNSTDKWMDTVKWAYGRVHSSWHTYQKILGRSVAKMTWYTKQSN